MANYKVTVGEEELMVQKSTADELDVSKINANHFHVLKNYKAYNIEVISTNFLNKELTISVNGNNHHIKIEDEYDQMVKQMGLFSNASQKLNNIKAPMPGLIVDVMVEEGQTIEEGTPLIVLSAMKMENIILSQGEGVIKSVAVKKDDAVDKGQIIIEID